MIYLRKYGVGAEQNEKKTLLKKVKILDLINEIQNNDIVSITEKHIDYEELTLWDFGVRASKYIKAGDIIYIMISGRYNDKLYYGQVVEKINDRNGEIGDIVGWHRIQLAPWGNPVLIKDFVKLEGLYKAVDVYLNNAQQLEKDFFKLS